MNDKITLAHGAGGREMEEILQKLIFSKVENRLKKIRGGVGIDIPDDGAAIPIGEGKYLVVSQDTYTVKPIFFPGGDIGKLAACGSINDVLMMGARPMAMLDGILVEEGFSINTLQKIIDSYLTILRENNIATIGGDFKVMPKGEIDQIVISTVGIGIAEKLIIDNNVKEGDKIIVTGSIGDHGATIMALQHGIEIESEELRSDVQPLTKLMLPLIERYSNQIHAARDPTRGGLAMTLNDWANMSETVIILESDKIPIKPQVQAYSEMLGIDPLYLANEGVAILSVNPNVAEEIVSQAHKLGYSEATIIGEVKKSEKYPGFVLIKSEVGGLRILEPPMGEIIPRIC